MAVQFLGSFFCDHCSHGMRESVWLLDGARLCATHYRHVVGELPPPALSLEAIAAPPPADPAWTRLVDGLRMRPRAGAPGIELQAVRNVQLEVGSATVSQAPAWTLNDEQLVDLVIAASAHRDDPAPNRVIVRSLLLRVLHGTTTP